MTLHRYAIFCFDEISFPWLTYTETNKFWIKKQIYKWMKNTSVCPEIMSHYFRVYRGDTKLETS